jgi:glycerate 2-kinase
VSESSKGEVLGGPRPQTRLLLRAFERALEAAAADASVAAVLRELPPRPALLLGAGKAAAAMAAAFCAGWGAPIRGLVVTRYGHGLKGGERADGVEVVEAGHPSPDSASLAAGARLLELAASARAAEGVYCLISGGGSALAAVPLPGLTFAQKRRAADFLIRAGADIREINCVRKHLSALKGGRLAVAAHPVPVTTLAISDVPGDDVADIASGPTIPDPTTQADAKAILEHYRYPRADELASALSDPRFESPKPQDPAFSNDTVRLIASASTALAAAGALLEAEGYRVLQLGDDLDDEAQQLGRAHAALAKRHKAAGDKVALLSGGETRVVLGAASGRGGRNLEYLAALAAELDGCEGVYALAADTDGIDGDGDHAGAIVAPGMPLGGSAGGPAVREALAAHDTYRFFDARGALIRTGPTRTNVNDFRLILCEP